MIAEWSPSQPGVRQNRKQTERIKERKREQDAQKHRNEESGISNKAKPSENGNGNPYLRVGSDAIRGHIQDTRQEIRMYARSRLHDHAVGEKKKKKT